MEDDALKAVIAHWTKPPRRHTESSLIKRLEAAAKPRGCRLFRNQVGTYRLSDGRWITSGLCVGSSDLIGYTRVTIRPEDVGRPVAVFTAIEAKAATGRATDAQRAFIQQVLDDGGLAQIVRSVTDLETALTTWQTRGQGR